MARVGTSRCSSLFRTAALCFAVGASTAILVGGTIALVAPSPAQATAVYAQQTKLPCGKCHTTPTGGPTNDFGKAFAANGHKVPK
jgi:hypothetical protein